MIINVNGKIVEPGEAYVPVLDHGFLFGDSVYEVVRTANGRLFTAEEHLDRLERSAAAIRLQLPLTREGFITQMERTHAKSGNSESYIRIVVTRGAGELELHPRSCKAPTWLLIVKPLTKWPESDYTEGVKVSLVKIHRNPHSALSPSIKSGNYLNNVIAIMQAHDVGAVEGVMLNPEGWVTECTTSNIWIVRRGEALTPSLECGLLPGITRQLLLDLAAANNIPAREERINKEELLAADEAFLSSTTRGVMPVRMIDDHIVGDGSPGPVTLRLMQLLEERIRVN